MSWANSLRFIALLVLPVLSYTLPECGEFTPPNNVLQTRIVNGELATPGEFPWQVSIQRQVRPRVQSGIAGLPPNGISNESPVMISEEEEDILESVIWTQPFLAKLYKNNQTYMQEIINWPPPIPPLPTHPPDHHAPTHPPSLPTFPPNVKPWAPGAPEWPPSNIGDGVQLPQMPPVPTFPPPHRPFPPVITLPTTTRPITISTTEATPSQTFPTISISTTTSLPLPTPTQPPKVRPPKQPVDKSQRWQHFCGGSIIENNWILTAAHCVENFKYSYQPGTIRVVAGTVNWKDVDNEDAQVMLVDRVIVHHGWTKDLGQHDVALLHLATPVEYVKTDKVSVNRICLSRVINQEHSGMSTSSGWGFLNKDHRVTPDLLRRVDLPVVDHNTCRNAFSRVIGVSKLQVCAGQSPRGNCMGDSGGPLIQKQNNRAVQIGIVSFSIPCATPGYPDVFTRVSKFIDWITSNTGVSF